MLTDVLRPVSRYWWRDRRPASGGEAASRGGWRLLPYSEFVKRGCGRKPTSGVLQVLAAQGFVIWPAVNDSGFTVVHHEALRFAPRLLPTNDAPSVAQALEDLEPELAWPKLQEVLRSARVRVMLMTFTADLDAANVRVQHFWADRIAERNCEAKATGSGAVCVFWVAPCLSHVLNTLTSKAFNSNLLIPRLHAVCFTLNEPKRWESVMAALRQTVEEDLRIGYFRGQRPPAGNRRHSLGVLQFTLLRHRYTKVPLVTLALHCTGNRQNLFSRTLVCISGSVAAMFKGMSDSDDDDDYADGDVQPNAKATYSAK